MRLAPIGELSSTDVFAATVTAGVNPAFATLRAELELACSGWSRGRVQ